MQMYTLEQRFSTGSSWTAGVRNKIFLGAKCYFWGWEFVCSCMYFFQRNRDIWRLASAITRKNVIQSNYSRWRYEFNNLSCYFCFTLRLPRCRWPVMWL